MQLTMEEQVLLKLLERELFGGSVTLVKSIDWRIVAKEAMYQSSLLPAFSHMEQIQDIPSEICNSIKKQSAESVKANLLNFQWHGQIHSLMQSLGIPYCILKGAASAMYYPEPLLREMGDVDFLVRKQDLEQVGQLLESMGFVRMEAKEYHHHIDYQKENVLLEVHFDSPGIPKGEAEPIVRKYLEPLLEQSRMAENLPFPVRVPSEFHHGLVMLLHLQTHLMSEGIGIRHLCDWALFLKSIGEERFLQLFQTPLQEMGLWKFTQILSLAAAFAFDLPKETWMGEEEELALELLLDMMAGGTNGRKDEQRRYESMFISDSRKLTEEKSRVRQIFETASQIAYGYWPVMRTWKILLPFGWLMLYIRRGYRVLTGKRTKVDYLEAYKNSSGRKELYRQLHIFERKVK